MEECRLPVTREEPAPKRGNFKATPGTLLVNGSYVQKAINGTAHVVIDARAAHFYNGAKSGLPRDGHIPGAINIPYTELLNKETNQLKPEEQLRAYFASAITNEKELIAYCFIGQTASVVYLAGRLLDYNIKLYDGGMQEWSRIDYLPLQLADSEQSP